MHYGVDDINGTLIEENIAHQSGSQTIMNQVDNLVRWIKERMLSHRKRWMVQCS